MLRLKRRITTFISVVLLLILVDPGIGYSRVEIINTDSSGGILPGDILTHINDRSGSVIDYVKGDDFERCILAGTKDQIFLGKPFEKKNIQNYFRFYKLAGGKKKFETIGKKYKKAECFSSGSALVKKYARKKSGPWGLLDLDGKMLTDFIFDDFERYHYEIRGVSKSGKWGLLDPEGKMLTDFIYDEVDVFTDSGVYKVRKGKKWGYVNSRGKEVTGFVFSYASVFIGDLASVKQNGKYGIIDKSGRIIVEPSYSSYDEIADVQRSLNKDRKSAPSK